MNLRDLFLGPVVARGSSIDCPIKDRLWLWWWRCLTETARRGSWYIVDDAVVAYRRNLSGSFASYRPTQCCHLHGIYEGTHSQCSEEDVCSCCEVEVVGDEQQTDDLRSVE